MQEKHHVKNCKKLEHNVSVETGKHTGFTSKLPQRKQLACDDIVLKSFG